MISTLGQAYLVAALLSKITTSALVGRDKQSDGSNSLSNINERDTVSDYFGDRLTSNFTVINVPVDSSEGRVSSINTNQKRGVGSRRIDFCPDPERPAFKYSQCDYASNYNFDERSRGNAKAFKIACARGAAGLAPSYSEVVSTGTCGPEEFCVQLPTKYLRYRRLLSTVAYCVSHENVIKLISAGASPAPSHQEITVHAKQAPGFVGGSFDVVVLSPDESRVVQADSIAVTALAKDTING